MAKVAFSKLGLKPNTEVNMISYGDIAIEVKQYLPIDTKADMIGRIINLSNDDNGYYNPLKVKVYLALEIMYCYTNINFTEKMKENPTKLYDTLVSSGLFDIVIEAIPDHEVADIEKSVWDIISNIYEYKNSAAGIVNALANDYNETSMDLNELNSKITDPNALAILKEIMPLMGNVDLG